MGDFLFDDCQKFHFSTSGFDYDLPEWGDILVYQQVGLHTRPNISYLYTPAHTHSAGFGKKRTLTEH